MVSQYKSGLGFMRLVRQVPPNSKFCRFTTVVKRSSRPTYIDLPWLTKLVSEISWNHVPKSWKSCPICGSIHPHQDYSKYVFGYPPWLYSILSYFSPYMKKQLQSRIRAKPTILWSKKQINHPQWHYSKMGGCSTKNGMVYDIVLTTLLLNSSCFFHVNAFTATSLENDGWDRIYYFYPNMPELSTMYPPWILW